MCLSLSSDINEPREMALSDWVSSSFVCKGEKGLPDFQSSYHQLGPEKGPST